MQATRSAPDSVLATLEEVFRPHAVRTRTPLTSLERAMPVGGVWTPRVAEVACTELGARLPRRPDGLVGSSGPGCLARANPSART